MLSLRFCSCIGLLTIFKSSWLWNIHVFYASLHAAVYLIYLSVPSAISSKLINAYSSFGFAVRRQWKIRNLCSVLPVLRSIHHTRRRTARQRGGEPVLLSSVPGPRGKTSPPRSHLVAKRNRNWRCWWLVRRLLRSCMERWRNIREVS